MPMFAKHEPGTFCWVDLSTTQQQAAKEFYHGLFGWEYEDLPVGEGHIYSMCKLRGKSVAAMATLCDDLQAKGVPPSWTSYISTPDVDTWCRRAKQMGATVDAEPYDVFDAGRMAFLTDPTGACFALWQPKEHIGAEIRDEAGSLVWNELATHNVEASRAFYSELCNWKSQHMDMGRFVYTTFCREDKHVGGMMPLQPEWGEIPSHWAPYFAVEHCDVTAKKATETGGIVMVPPTDIPSVGRFALIQDPQGAMFYVLQPIEPFIMM